MLAALLLVPGPAWAVECTLATAIYRDGASGYEIRFMPRTEDRPLTQTNMFELHLPDGPVIPGKIEWTSGASRPIGTMGVDCDNDSGFCEYWSGIVYELRDGRISSVSGEDSVPPEQILFSDLGATLWYSNLRLSYDMQSTPEDAFLFSGCTQ